ncbi:MAG: alpha/beta hydrolase [Candidatus Eisenbacteria bacterium]|jgi:pimeloyl-ACP methyl ester carboxylesterase|nr:alpha/beta hydrolase [Candidatus Eisenbacteria bacterium]
MTTLFFIHGMWCAPWVWEGFTQAFEEAGYRCVRATLRHHGEGPGTPEPRLGATSLLDYAADLESEIRALGDPPVVVGHSMGGLLAQMLAARGLARAAVLLTPASPHGVMALRPSVMRSFASVMCQPAFWRRPVRLSFAEASYGIFNMTPESKRRALYDKFCHESGRAAAEIGLWFLDSRRSAAVDASSVTCPMLVIGAARDRMTPSPIVRRVAGCYPTATYHEFADHGHWLIGEPGSEAVADVVVEWLKTHGAA